MSQNVCKRLKRCAQRIRHATAMNATTDRDGIDVELVLTLAQRVAHGAEVLGARTVLVEVGGDDASDRRATWRVLA